MGVGLWLCPRLGGEMKDKQIGELLLKHTQNLIAYLEGTKTLKDVTDFHGRTDEEMDCVKRRLEIAKGNYVNKSEKPNVSSGKEKPKTKTKKGKK